MSYVALQFPSTWMSEETHQAGKAFMPMAALNTLSWTLGGFPFPTGPCATIPPRGGKLGCMHGNAAGVCGPRAGAVIDTLLNPPCFSCSPFHWPCALLWAASRLCRLLPHAPAAAAPSLNKAVLCPHFLHPPSFFLSPQLSLLSVFAGRSMSYAQTHRLFILHAPSSSLLP